MCLLTPTHAWLSAMLTYDASTFVTSIVLGLLSSFAGGENTDYDFSVGALVVLQQMKKTRVVTRAIKTVSMPAAMRQT